ncbi:MAG: hypothetical protein IIA62_10560, partial [Nitrospinae bacterium]|nr:hypothetical protein [Nitrospinota bacterium]
LGRKEKTKKFLDEIYDLRSCAEHMNDFDEVFKHYPENNRNDTGLLRCYQVEIFSSKLFLKLLSDQTLLDIIKSDVALGELWKKPDDAIMNILGDSINIPFELN